MRRANLDIIKKPELTGIKNHWKWAKQVKLKLNYLYNWILTLAIFVKYSCRVYNNKKVTRNNKTR